MVDLVITPANVIAGSNANTVAGTAGVAITAGQAVYKDPVTKKYLLADTNAAAQEARKTVGIALHAAAINQPINVQTSGEITIGATLVAGSDYYGSDTPGGICPRADVGSGESVCLLGLAKSTSILVLDVQFPGVQL